MKTYYQIDGENNRFYSLRAAKEHIWLAYTQAERIKYLRDTVIVKIVNDEAVTVTPIFVTDDGYSFGKTIKL